MSHENCNHMPIDEETQKNLDRVGELVTELRQKMLEVMMPTTLEQAPGVVDVELRVTQFFSLQIDLLIMEGIERVKKHWPEQMATPEQEAGMQGVIEALDQMLNGQPLPQPGSIEDPDSNMH